MSDSPGVPRPSLSSWCLNALKAGSVLGVTLGLTSAFSLAMLGKSAGAPALHFSQLTSAALVTTALSGLGCFALAALGWPLLGWRWGRIAYLSALGALSGSFTLAMVASAALRILTGAYLSLGAIDFLLAGGSHLLVTVLSGFAVHLVALLVVTLVAAWAMLKNARHALSENYERSARDRVSLGVGASLVGFALLPWHYVRDLEVASPELAFLASLDPDPIDAEPPEPTMPLNVTPTEIPRPEIVDGPDQSEGAKWREAVKKLPPHRTNVLVLTLESVAPKHLGYEGYPRDTTPNLDQLARESVRYRRAWTTATHSNYAQMAILSSLFPRRVSGLDVYKRLDYPRILLHDVFHELGYATATISSQDETWQGMIKFEQTGTPTFFRHARDFVGMRVDIGSELVVLDHVTVDVAADWIRRQGQRPWSLYVNLQATHFPYKLQAGIPTPYQPTAVTRGEFDYLSYPESDRQAVINRYDNALHYVDEQVGKLMKALDRMGELHDTIWIVTADHGEAFHDHGQVTHGKTLYDSEARVPLLVHWPAKLEPADVDEPVSNMDVMPTLLDLLELPPHPAFQGRSFADVAEHAKNPSGVFMNIQGLRSEEAVVCWPWKFMVDRSDRAFHLFNLERDPAELDDRMDKERDIAETLKATLSAQISAQVAYHKKGNAALSERYAPRLLACPAIPGVREVATTPDSTPPAKALPDDPRRPAEAPQKSTPDERKN